MADGYSGLRPGRVVALLAPLVVALAVIPSPADPLPMPRRANKAPAVQPELLDLPLREGVNDPDGTDNKTAKRAPRDQPIVPRSYPGGMYPAIPITLPDVLKLAVLANLDIAQANLVVERARIALSSAYARFLPDFSAGIQHQAHDGAIQRTEGTVIDANRDSLFVGGGPSLTLPFSVALFGPGQARWALEAARFGQARVTQETLVRVADAYFAVLRARRQLARLDEVLDMLTSEEESDLRGGSKGLLPLIKAFVKAGTALPSDQARVEADVVRRHGERVRALEDVRTASAELSRLLHLNAGYFLLPAEDYRFPIEVPGGPWFQTPIEPLVEQALRGRPELAENHARIEAAILRWRAAKWQPILPNLQVGLTYGGFGGGPELKTNPQGRTFLGNSGNIKDFDNRTDLDISLFWRLDNMGLGNRLRIRDARIQTEQAEVQQLFLQDLVVAQVVQSMEGVQRGYQRYRIYRAGLFDDKGKPTGTVYRSLRLNFTRIKGGQGLPLEVLDSTRRHSDVLQGYADTISDYDRARFRLLISLGMSPEAILDPACMPLPPACASPDTTPVIEPPATQPTPEALNPPKNAGNGAKAMRQINESPVKTPVQTAAPAPGADNAGVVLPPLGEGQPTRRNAVPFRLPPRGSR